jgi:putative Mg2+ transporter-C (MgtC) family protein
MTSIDIIWDTVRAEFSDLHDLAGFTRVFIRLMLAVILGGVLGYERQLTGKPAGLRTHMLVSLGAALFVLVPLQAGMPVNDVSRVLQGVIAGIGFLGAGAIIKMSEEGQVKGLTTAASIWLTAAIGVAAGMGREATAVFATLLALIILGVLHKLDKYISARRKKHHPHEHASGNGAPSETYQSEE